MNHRPCFALTAFIAVVVALTCVLRFRPALPPPPPYDCGDILREQLRSLHVDGSVVPCADRPAAYYLLEPGASASAVAGLPTTPQYAVCWRGVLLAETRGWGDDGPNEVQAGSFHFFGDAGMVRSVREGLGHPAGP